MTGQMALCKDCYCKLAWQGHFGSVLWLWLVIITVVENGISMQKVDPPEMTCGVQGKAEYCIQVFIQYIDWHQSLWYQVIDFEILDGGLPKRVCILWCRRPTPGSMMVMVKKWDTNVTPENYQFSQILSLFKFPDNNIHFWQCYFSGFWKPKALYWSF